MINSLRHRNRIYVNNLLDYPNTNYLCQKFKVKEEKSTINMYDEVEDDIMIPQEVAMYKEEIIASRKNKQYQSQIQ